MQTADNPLWDEHKRLIDELALEAQHWAILALTGAGHGHDREKPLSRPETRVVKLTGNWR